ncbi:MULTISPECIES: carboxyl transferase domain-containing protein [Amycolatopsis]|uniref:Carboxyl transferase domain-containing protein n=2 Tax=Amycolatopsis TaxID=1813 RepID=A0ABW5IAN5_9PSEU
MGVNREQWEPLLADLAARRSAAQAMGGEERLAGLGGPNARDRIAALLDPGSFAEIGLLGGELPADGFVAGSGSVDGKPVLVGAEDFSVAGGSIGVAAASKRERIARLAGQERVPLLMFLEGAGHRPSNSLHPHRPAPNDLQALADLSGKVPVVAVVAGPSAGHSALTAALANLVVLVRGSGQLFSAGPPLVRAALGEDVSKEELGGTGVHAVHSGLVDLVAADLPEAIGQVRRYLSLIPPSALAAEQERRTDSLLDLIPPNDRVPYDVRPVVEELLDRETWFELGRDHAASMLTGLGRLGGHVIGVVANQPAVRAGAIDTPAADKAARFIEHVTGFGVPLLMLADNPGLLGGRDQERAGVLRAGARLFLAQHRAEVPKFHVTMRKAFGFGSSVMGQNAFDRQTLSLALPGATLGAMPARVGAETSKADAGTSQALAEGEAAGPWRLAGTVTYDDVVHPAELRNRLLSGLRLAIPAR